MVQKIGRPKNWSSKKLVVKKIGRLKKLVVQKIGRQNNWSKKLVQKVGPDGQRA
jgi:hypothetical protein